MIKAILRMSMMYAAGIFLLCGCAQYEYRLTQPAQYAQRISTKPVTVSEEPLHYSFVAQRNHVEMRITNPGKSPVTLQPETSYVVDPWQQTHPIREQIIAPAGFISLPLPPRPVKYDYWTSSFDRYPKNSWDPVFSYIPDAGESPTPLAAPESRTTVTSPYNWDWKSGTIRLHLGFKSAGKSFEYDFVFERSKK
jgi:hypothetical protein